MKQTVTSIQKTKGVKKLTMITAYDALFSKLFDNEVDFILVGDSLNMSFAGNSDTLSIGMNEMIIIQKQCVMVPKILLLYVICHLVLILLQI